ncbi:MAG TPA: cell envelope integrity protein TolA [Opitutus sp.]|nr:cell envelope integrity protein TolA [Opitutus sp.]
MTSNRTNAFFMSSLLHGGVVALVLFFTYGVNRGVKDPPKIFELVAGEGDNYMATEAPALGVVGGIKIAIPEPPAPKPEPPAAKMEPAPVEPAPVMPAAPPEPVIERAPIAPAAKPVEKIPDFSKDVKRIAKKRQDRLEAKERKTREAAERKAKEEALKSQRMTKADFDKQNKAKATSTKSGTGAPKVAKIDAEGIAKGVVGGSTANKTGGAGGRALTREEGEAMDLYFSLLKSRLREALDKPPGLADSLVAIVEVNMLVNGTMTGARIKKSSGSSEFDQAALAAVTRVRSIGARPDKKSETIEIPFRMRELE